MDEDEPRRPVDLEQVLALVARQLGAERVSAGDRLIEDLGAESADLLNLVVAVEDCYGVRIAEEELPSLSTPERLLELIRERR